MKAYISIFILLVSLAGCSRGPDELHLLSELQERLDKRIIPGLFSIKNFERRGHQPYSQHGNEGIIVYYKTKLLFNRDYKLSDWNTPSASSLVSILGATPASVIGIQQTGNTKGDELLVYGFLTYEKSGGKWASSQYLADGQVAEIKEAGTFIAEDDVAEGRYYNGTLKWQSRLTNELANTLESVSTLKDTNQINAYKSELERLITLGKVQATKEQGNLTLMTGEISGNYYNLGKGLQSVLSEKKSNNIEVIGSSGAIENLNLIREGLADFALTQSDLALMSVNGTGPYQDKPDTNLRALASLYPEAIQIVVHKNSGIARIEELANKKVSIGGRGSGGRANALQILEVYGLNEDDFPALDMEHASQALLKGEIDALITTTAFPSKFIEALGDNAKFLSFEANTRSKLAEKYGFVELVIPAGTYIAQEEDIFTIGVTALLVARATVTDSQVLGLLEAIYESTGHLAKTNVQANYINEASATRGIHIDFHSAVSGKN